tara:strand:+ start:1867 stop:2118 length:252 start_codon:yes stop_codon:yes gene_type:complete
MAKKISETTSKTLRAKANKSKRYTIGDLKKVYSRGQGAYLGSGSRPGVSMAAWAMARVNSFMRGSRKHDLDLQAKARKRNRKK